MWRIFTGAVLVVAGIAAFIEAHSHRPGMGQIFREIPNEGFRGQVAVPVHTGLSQTPYDLLRIGAWALVIFGALLIVIGFIRYWRAQP
jgi:hypothetical protein